MHAELSVGAFIATVLVLVPLPWHWRARNVATLSMIVWLFVSNVIYGVNSIIWAGSVSNSAPVWCDVATKIQMGANMGLPACCLCICVHLERISSVRQVRTSRTDKMWRMFFDAAVCWGFPILYMALHYIVQGHRFDILEDFGCRPTVYVSLPAIFLVWVPPMTAALATFGFAAMALKNFFHRRLTFAAHLQNYSTGLTTSRYLRLMSMSVVQMIWTVLVTSLNIWFSCQHGLRLWISWQNVHSDFSQIAYFPTALIPRESLRWTYALWWAVPFSALLFVVFFASGEEAMNEYRNILRWIHSLIFPQFGTKIEAPLTSTRQSPSFSNNSKNSTDLCTLSIAGSYGKNGQGFIPSNATDVLSEYSASCGTVEGDFQSSPPSSTHQQWGDRSICDAV